MGLPFLLFDWKAYLMRSFDLQRVFLFKWTVNWRFLPESFFLDRRFHFFLLFCHLISLTAFGYYVWFRSHGGLRASLIELLQGGIRTRTGVAETMFALFTSNLIGISFSRSLHYQFYSWYFHQLPFLLFWNFPSNVDKFEKIPLKSISVRALLLLAIELCWNVYPSTVWSSFLLHLCHMTLLCLCLPIPQLRPRSRTREHREYMISQRFCQRFLASTSSQPYKVFDRNLKRKQRDWAVKQPDFAKAQYLKEEVGWRIADKVFDLTKFNPLVLDIGCGPGHISPHLIKENVGKIIQCDISEAMVTKSASNDETEVERLVCDEETLEPFKDEQFDLLLSSLSAHWINDLPGWFRRCYSILKPDCPLIGAVFTEDTLYELRCSLQLAEMDLLGGVSTHISPFVKAQDIGGLLTAAGFQMITLDTEEIQVGYPSMFALMYDLQLMAESNATDKRALRLRNDVLLAAQAIYKAMYSKKEDHFPATFRILSFIGWKPGPDTPKPAKRGSQNVSLKDLSKLVESQSTHSDSEKK
ncbi:hypothetical protein WR25_19054 isoform A [Diploscapter pachys]|nr:hypothetical protein WR25_19054 isoform A [Diploscapter pachys]